MEKDDTPTSKPKTSPAPSAAQPESARVGLDEACRHLSLTFGPEAVGAFHHVETWAGHLNGTLDEFRVRFSYFMNSPA